HPPLPGAAAPPHLHACPTRRSSDLPRSGTAALGPVGTGIVLAGGRHDTVIGNRIRNQGAWGVLVVPYPDTGPPPPIAHCEGGRIDRKSTRLNSSHEWSSYAVFCLKR